jgi:hypothetical protein
MLNENRFPGTFRGHNTRTIADFGKMVPDFKKVVPGLATKHTAFENRKCYGNFLCVYN